MSTLLQFKKLIEGHLSGSAVKHLSLAQVIIPGSWDQVPHQDPFSVESLLLPLPAAPRFVLSLLLSLSLSDGK